MEKIIRWSVLIIFIAVSVVCILCAVLLPSNDGISPYQADTAVTAFDPYMLLW
jgi:hypothetical protein